MIRQVEFERGRFAPIGLAVLLAFCGASCSGKHNSVTVQNEEPPATAPRLAAVIRMNDPQPASQLLSGFYLVESGSWRWTAGKFSVRLGTPPGAAQGGAVLNLALNVPEVAIRKLGKLTLTAAVNGTPLKSDSYEKAGAATYSADVPASLLSGESAKVDFALDKSLAPSGADKRELGIIANSVSLSSR